MSPGEIEQTKLLANALDRTSAACVTVGVLAPTAAVIYNISGNASANWVFVLGTGIWLLAAVALHLIARRVLKGLDR